MPNPDAIELPRATYLSPLFGRDATVESFEEPAPPGESAALTGPAATPSTHTAPSTHTVPITTATATTHLHPPLPLASNPSAT